MCCKTVTCAKTGKAGKAAKTRAFPAFSDQKRMPMPVTNW